MTFRLSEDNEFIIEYHAQSDRDNIINLTNHSYLNLSGCTRNILDHHIKINASRYTSVNEVLIPTGEIALLSGTPANGFFCFNTDW